MGKYENETMKLVTKSTLKRETLILTISIILTGLGFIFLNSCKKEEVQKLVTDIDGNVYKTITIGKQIWMVENLKVTHYRNGEIIPNVTKDTAWLNLTTGAFCNFNNDTTYALIYGHLYNWYSVNDNRNIAPKGWHIPSDNEWKTLTDYLGGDSISGSKLKEIGISHWLTPNKGATNETGFTALPGGCVAFNGVFAGIGFNGQWWSSTENSINTAKYRLMSFRNILVYRDNINKKLGFSIRCLKD